MITNEEALRRVDQFWKDLQTLEFELESKGWRDAAKAVYGARLRISEARDALPIPRPKAADK